MRELKYLIQYSPELIRQAEPLLSENRLGQVILDKYPQRHEIAPNGALYAYTMELKNQYMRRSGPLSKAVYDDKIQIFSHALGTHTYAARVQGKKLKTRNEIRIASVFRKAPIEFLRMIVVHELAHLKELEHNKAFYNLCIHMAPNYAKLEFDLRLYLTYLDLIGELY